MTLEEALEALKEHADKDKDAVVKAVHEAVPDLHQAIFSIGYGRGQEKLEATKATLQAQVDQANEKAKELEGKLENAKGGDEAVERLQRDVDHWKGEAQRLKGEIDSKQEEFQAQRREEARKAHLGRLRDKLGKHLLDDYAARTARDPEVAGRIRITDEGELEVLQDGKDVPLTVPDKQDPLDVLVKEIVKGTAPSLIKADGDAGAGIDSGGSGGTKIEDQFLETSQKRRASRPNPLVRQPTGAGEGQQ